MTKQLGPIISNEQDSTGCKRDFCVHVKLVGICKTHVQKYGN